MLDKISGMKLKKLTMTVDTTDAYTHLTSVDVKLNNLIMKSCEKLLK